MAVTSVLRLLRENGMRVSENGEWELRSLYFVSGPTSQLECYGATDPNTGLKVPVRGDVHALSPALFCTELDAEWAGNAQGGDTYLGDFWIVRVHWKTRGPIAEINVPVKWRWDQGVQSVQVDCDKDGNAIVNSAGDPFSARDNDDEILPTLIVQRSEPIYDPALGYQLSNSLNDAALTIFGSWSVDQEQMRCIYYKPTHWTQASAPSVINEYAFEFKPGYRPFQIRKVDEGFNGWGTFSGGTTRARFFAGVDEEPWPDPVLLDGAGKPIDANFSVGQISGGKTTLISPIQNPGATGAPPHYPPWAELDPNSPAGSKILIFTRKRTNSFNGLIPGVM